MRKNIIRFSLLIVLLAAAAQMPSASASLGQNTNSSTTSTQPTPTPVNPCRKRCRIVYSKCLHVAGADPAKRKACAVRYRACLRRCK